MVKKLGYNQINKVCLIVSARIPTRHLRTTACLFVHGFQVRSFCSDPITEARQYQARARSEYKLASTKQTTTANS